MSQDLVRVAGARGPVSLLFEHLDGCAGDDSIGGVEICAGTLAAAVDPVGTVRSTVEVDVDSEVSGAGRRQRRVVIRGTSLIPVVRCRSKGTGIDRPTAIRSREEKGAGRTRCSDRALDGRTAIGMHEAGTCSYQKKEKATPD